MSAMNKEISYTSLERSRIIAFIGSNYPAPFVFGLYLLRSHFLFIWNGVCKDNHFISFSSFACARSRCLPQRDCRFRSAAMDRSEYRLRSAVCLLFSLLTELSASVPHPFHGLEPYHFCPFSFPRADPVLPVCSHDPGLS